MNGEKKKIRKQKKGTESEPFFVFSELFLCRYLPLTLSVRIGVICG